MGKKEKYDGRSRPANKAYDEGWNRIFKARAVKDKGKVKNLDEAVTNFLVKSGIVNDGVKVEDLTKILNDVEKDYDAAEDLKKIEDRNGF